MKLTCIANHAGVDVPENFHSDQALKCGVCGLPMRDQRTLQPSMSGPDFDAKVAAYYKAAVARAHEIYKASIDKAKADNPRTDGKGDGMADLMMMMAGTIFVGFFEKSLRELVVGAPEESKTLAAP